MTTAHEVIEVLRNRRRQFGISQNRLAAEMNVERRTVQRLESGEYEPKLRTVLKWAKALGLDLMGQKDGSA